MLHHQKVLSNQTGKLKLQVREICGNLDQAQGLEVCGHNYLMVRENGKVNIWVRKERRGENTIQQLSQVE